MVAQRRLRDASSRSWAVSRGAGFSRGRKYAGKREAELGLREMLVQQCIISGLILFLALTISFLPLGFVSELRGSVKHALSQEGTADGLLDMAGGLADRYESLKKSLKSMFLEPSAEVGEQWRDGDIPLGIDYSPGVGIPPQDGDRESENASIQSQPDTDARIDENVLRIINTGEFYEVDDNEKKP